LLVPKVAIIPRPDAHCYSICETSLPTTFEQIPAEVVKTKATGIAQGISVVLGRQKVFN